MPVALVGKVYCKVDASYSPIEVGDLLTTSLTPGHAMKANDHVKAFGAVIGKALRRLDARPRAYSYSGGASIIGEFASESSAQGSIGDLDICHVDVRSKCWGRDTSLCHRKRIWSGWPSNGITTDSEPHRKCIFHGSQAKHHLYLSVRCGVHRIRFPVASTPSPALHCLPRRRPHRRPHRRRRLPGLQMYKRSLNHSADSRYLGYQRQ